MGRNPPKQPWSPPRKEAVGKVICWDQKPESQCPVSAQHYCGAELMGGIWELNVLSPFCYSSSGPPV